LPSAAAKPSVSDHVFDASAILALVLAEEGAAQVGRNLSESGRISAVNLAEVVTRLIDLGYSDRDVDDSLDGLHLEVISFDSDLAYAAARLRRRTRVRGLSLGDRACLALARAMDAAAITADRSWAELDLGIDVVSVR